MANLQDIINLAKADGGKFFVVDEKGEAKLVIMSLEDYQRLLLGKLQRQVLEVEKINREIIEAQLTEEKTSQAQSRSERSSATGINQEIIIAQLKETDVPSPLPKPQAPRLRMIPRVDLRAEVIDPSFDFEGPKVEIDDL